MTASERQTILALLDGYVCNSLDEQQQSSLLMLLTREPEARQIYIEYMDLHATLNWTLQARSENESDDTSRDISSKTMLTESSVARTNVIPGSNEEILGGSAPITSGLLNKVLLSFGFTSAFAMFGILATTVVVTYASMCYFRRSEPLAAVVTESSSFQPSTLKIDSGTATLALDKIGYVELQGPAEFEMLGPLRSRLLRGGIKMRVTESTGHGFTVETPYGKVVDLGTEFALNVSETGKARLAVLEGSVDLQTSTEEQPTSFSNIQRLVGGEGVTFDEAGQLDRVMAIVKGTSISFRDSKPRGNDIQKRVIVDVHDNRRIADTKKFYEIVPGGFEEDAVAYVDRLEHEWNGTSSEGLPKYLLGADYVKPFNEDKLLPNVRLSIVLGKPATLYVFFDKRLPPPKWLKSDFKKNGDVVGMDNGRWNASNRDQRGSLSASTRYKKGNGPGVSIDARFNVWERTVNESGTIVLGPNIESDKTASVSMYGIAAVALDTADIVGENKTNTVPITEKNK
jgi:hypothetical protein